MSDQIKHECGIVVIRLLKPLSYFAEKYGSPLYGIQKLKYMMLRLRNRGQDGAGIATVKLQTEPGNRYISRKRSNGVQPITEIFDSVLNYYAQAPEDKRLDAEWLQANLPYFGELLMGHLRYGTHGKNSIENVHPFHRQSNYINRNLILAGNFNLTNVDELFEELVDLGQYPKEKSDTVTVLEKIGHFLDDEVQRLHTWFKPDGYTNQQINELIFDHLDVGRMLKRASKKFDGGYVMGGLIGHGDAFVMRDPNGIRPAFYYSDDEVAVVASERPAIQSTFNVPFGEIRELKPAHALIIKRDGRITEQQFIDPKPNLACSFERIYFSRGSDRDIYQERKRLGQNLADSLLKAVDYDFKNTVFSYVPNTAEGSFFGLIEGINSRLTDWKADRITKLKGTPAENAKKIKKIMAIEPRFEKVVVKDEKLRTFITNDAMRGSMVSNVYDVTYGIVNNDKDTLILIDDSIVRGTTLKKKIISLVARLKPKRIIIASSAPQIRFPDCYGIDMSKMGNFVAFQALVQLLRENNKGELLDKVYTRCKDAEKRGTLHKVNHVAKLYDHFSYKEISAQIAQIITPPNIKAQVDIVYQTLDGLHAACPNHLGDWYFSGKYPTPGGNRVVNRAFMNYMEKKNVRAY